MKNKKISLQDIYNRVYHSGSPLMYMFGRSKSVDLYPKNNKICTKKSLDELYMEYKKTKKE